MRQLGVVVVAVTTCCGLASAQAPNAPPAFEVASIQLSTRPQPGMRGGVLRGTRYELRNATMVDLIRTAYNVQPRSAARTCIRRHEPGHQRAGG